MIVDIFKSIIKNFQTFLVTWIIVILINQLFIFGACFAPYCLIAALPHTSVIAVLITFFAFKENEEIENIKNMRQSRVSSNDTQHSFSQPKEDLDPDDFEDAQAPYCPKCGSRMVLRTARRGQYAGQKFWGCSQYPNCNGILNL